MNRKIVIMSLGTCILMSGCNTNSISQTRPRSESVSISSQKVSDSAEYISEDSNTPLSDFVSADDLYEHYSSTSAESTIDEAPMDEANEILRLAAEEVTNATTEEAKRKIAESTLDDLISKGLISDEYTYDEEFGLYSFRYTSGVLGGLMIKDFDEEFNAP